MSSNVANSAEHKASNVEHSTVVQGLGRFGDICYGVVHIVVAVLAIQLAFGGSGHSVDQKGAVATVAAQPFGEVVLWLIAVGLVAFGAWQLLCAVTGFQWIEKKGKRTRRRIGAAARGVAVLAIAVYTVRLLLSDPGKSSDSQSKELTARLMSVSGGRILVGAAGLAVVVAAGALAYRGLRRKFMRDLDLGKLSAGARKTTETLGVVGFVAKGVAYGIVGILVLIAAITFNPNKAGGLDDALRTLAGQPFGVVLLVIVALGLAAYGVYCFFEARCRKG
ncbi:MAG TPA: DUF1206 domain-containing protein [Pseudonocardiaceae bacterium]|nr:DUF1206 domain-containing protein [Pseudonocardiaceae bacterium]